MTDIKHLFVSLCTLLLTTICAIGQEYPKLIIPGDYPDPTIIREGEDYYMTHSPFDYPAGLLIWHSQDLMNWQPICRALSEYEGSVWAPDLIKYNGKYYIYYPAAGTNWVIWADNIKGPWSKPIDLKVGGIDPGHIADPEGNRYLHLNGGDVMSLTRDGLATTGERRKVYDGWQYPSEWETECFCLESPKLNYKDGYYYMTTAQGGTAGPATSHMVVSARSKTPVGPWENSPYNPIVHTFSQEDNWWSKGHGSLIDDVNGNWWIVYHAYAKGFHTLGRQTLIEPIEWTADGWFRTKSTNMPIIPKKRNKNGMPLFDGFSGNELGLQWTFWKKYAPASVTLQNNSLSLQGKGNNPADGQVLLTTATDKSYEIQVEINTGRNNKAGLILFYNEKAFAGIMSNGNQFTIYKDAVQQDNINNNYGSRFTLKIINKQNICTFMASKNGKNWQTLADNVDVSGLNHNNHGGFLALRIGLLSTGESAAVFKDFRYTGSPK